MDAYAVSECWMFDVVRNHFSFIWRGRNAKGAWNVPPCSRTDFQRCFIRFCFNEKNYRGQVNCSAQSVSRIQANQSEFSSCLANMWMKLLKIPSSSHEFKTTWIIFSEYCTGICALLVLKMMMVRSGDKRHHSCSLINVPLTKNVKLDNNIYFRASRYYIPPR